jgi:hypothetical protein
MPGDWQQKSSRRSQLPLDNFQIAVLKSLMPLRSPGSVFAGGSVLQRHAFRLSDDQDIFHASGQNIIAIADRDARKLREDGFEVTVRQPFEGLVEAFIARGNEGSTKIQWVEAGSWAFFAPVPDPDFGWRLHMADLATNKVLAAGGRREVRDYVDLFLIHKHVMPLWLAMWAAPSKDESWSPASLAEKISMKNNFHQGEIDEEIVSTIEISSAEVGRTIREAIEQARTIFERLPTRDTGKLFVDKAGGLVTDVEAILTGGSDIEAIEATKNGTWPSGPSIDHALIERVVEAFGWDGCNTLAGHDPMEWSHP